MKVLLVIAIAVGTVGTIASSRTAYSGLAVSQQAQINANKKGESPFACDTLALTAEIRKRHFDVLGPALRSMRKTVRELPNGYEFEFPNDEKTYQLLTEWVFQESQCCPFFDLSVRLEREHGSLVMSATGREGVKAFIQTDAARWIQPVKAEMK